MGILKFLEIHLINLATNVFCLLVENSQIWHVEYLLYLKIFPMPLGKIFIIQEMLNLDSLDLFIMPNVRIKKKNYHAQCLEN